ncbi:copper-binding protein, partial [Oleiphilus sp. HI0079]|uniref:copper-binding protein n=3 Tax=unclassified Oleiphilus TaxID=2631174 RepID=UPI000A5218E1
RHNRVVKALGEGRYQSVPIKIGYEGLSAANDNAVIEILNGLSEGESVVIAAQFLIDSESYVEAEFKRMEQQLNNPSEMAEPDKMAQEVLTKGVIEKVMPEMGMVTITHEPITEWDWPTMKMDFGFADSIEPNSFTEGATVDFILRKTGDWDYQITALGDQAVMQHSKQTQKLPQGAVKSNGIIRDVMLDMNMLQVVHEPIPEWEWPEMNM